MTCKELVQEGVEGGFIHPSDASFMIPAEAVPGRYYRLAKVYKERQTWPEMAGVTTSNVFVYSTELFLQLLGVCMGSRSSPIFACLFMGALELFMMTFWEQQGGLLPFLLRRFIDNLFFLWCHGEAELQRFLAHMNSCHPTIKFEVVPGCYNFATRAINFLDLQIWIYQEGFIQTTLHQKACRVVTYLLPSSAHPSFICSNIPYSLAFSLVRIESTQEGLDNNLAGNNLVYCFLVDFFGS